MADNAGQVLFWCAVLLGAAIVLGIAFFWLRKRLAAMDEESPAAVNPLGFTLADLRQMHAQGQISDEEFDFAKRKMVARAKAQLEIEHVADGEELEIEDLGDLTDATATHEEPQAPPDADSSKSPDKHTPSDGPSTDESADKNDDSGDEPPPPDDPPGGTPPPPKPPKHW